jgi:hypothetical protein
MRDTGLSGSSGLLLTLVRVMRCSEPSITWNLYAADLTTCNITLHHMRHINARFLILLARKCLFYL